MLQDHSHQPGLELSAGVDASYMANCLESPVQILAGIEMFPPVKARPWATGYVLGLADKSACTASRIRRSGSIGVQASEHSSAARVHS